MQYLFNQKERVLKEIKRAESLFIFLDFDGTLTPIVSNPEKAFLSDGMKAILRRLKKIPGVFLAIVSGRSLKDIRNRVDLKGIYYIGNHGLEIFKPRYGTKLLFPEKVVLELKKIRNRLYYEFIELEGVFIEDKGYILAIHYRNVNPRWVPSILVALREEMKRSSTPLRLGRGKKVFEIRPNTKVNKGAAILELLGQINPGRVLPIYIGDDQTDEDAFRALKGRERITISVGWRDHSSAQYYVKDPSEVHQFLKIIKKEFG